MSDDEGGGHTKGKLEGQFCSQRKDKCDCPTGKGNKYKSVCKGLDWGKYPQNYTSTIKNLAGKAIGKLFGARRRGPEAHHIACVASVTKIITTNTDIIDVVRNTGWCVNKKDNMIALPMWALTIEWYCKLCAISRHAEILTVANGQALMSPATKPPFQDRPQHDYDHAKYIEEVDKALISVVNKVKGVTGHEKQAEELAAALNDVISDFQGYLKERGARVGGTHEAWNLGMNSRNSDWYLPFSMADDGDAEKREFPLPDVSDKSTMAEKILEVAEAFWRESNPTSAFF
jgi:hypothetical protein